MDVSIKTPYLGVELLDLSLNFLIQLSMLDQGCTFQNINKKSSNPQVWATVFRMQERFVQPIRGLWLSYALWSVLFIFPVYSTDIVFGDEVCL